ncbi:hypothetical protein HNY73_004804 [Argiope bruennichi]|uniref:Uncharacterized protein n=1 Tax=Argiope bruennichi TaxID=94029 RepID=A0A8T0FUG9_ARGBR|nr:hypothetical protein HNY73_004804 [Argiope bruennichi]
MLKFNPSLSVTSDPELIPFSEQIYRNPNTDGRFLCQSFKGGQDPRDGDTTSSNPMRNWEAFQLNFVNGKLAMVLSSSLLSRAGTAKGNAIQTLSISALE